MTFHQLVAIYNHPVDDKGNLEPWYVEENEKDAPNPWRGSGLTEDQIAMMVRERNELNEQFLKFNEEMGRELETEVQAYKDTLVGNPNAEKLVWAFRESIEEKHIANCHRKMAVFRREQLERRKL